MLHPGKNGTNKYNGNQRVEHRSAFGKTSNRTSDRSGVNGVLKYLTAPCFRFQSVSLYFCTSRDFLPGVARITQKIFYSTTKGKKKKSLSFSFSLEKKSLKQLLITFPDRRANIAEAYRDGSDKVLVLKGDDSRHTAHFLLLKDNARSFTVTSPWPIIENNRQLYNVYGSCRHGMECQLSHKYF